MLTDELKRQLPKDFSTDLEQLYLSLDGQVEGIEGISAALPRILARREPEEVRFVQHPGQPNAYAGFITDHFTVTLELPLAGFEYVTSADVNKPTTLAARVLASPSLREGELPADIRIIMSQDRDAYGVFIRRKIE